MYVKFECIRISIEEGLIVHIFGEHFGEIFRIEEAICC